MHLRSCSKVTLCCLVFFDLVLSCFRLPSLALTRLPGLVFSCLVFVRLLFSFLACHGMCTSCLVVSCDCPCLVIALSLLCWLILSCFVLFCLVFIFSARLVYLVSPSCFVLLSLSCLGLSYSLTNLSYS
jgi:hypothetical protein